MKFGDLINYLDEEFPKDLSLPGDNDGVDICVDHNLEIGRILLALDVTSEAIDYAVTHGYNCILSHHTMLPQPLKKLDMSNAASRKAITLIKNNICAASFHTRLDAVDGGVNDCLLRAADLDSESTGNTVEPMYEGDVPIGRIVTLNEEINLRALAGNIKKSMENFYRKEFSRDININIKFPPGIKRVKKLGVVGGSGMSPIATAANHKVDAFFTGEGKYYDMAAACSEFNISVITAGHVETETVVLKFIKQKITEKFPEANADCFIGEAIGLCSL